MSIERRFGSGVAWMAAGNWTEQATSFAVFVVLARILGAEALGLMALALALVLICEALVRDSVADIIIAHPDPEPGHLNAAFTILGLLGGGLTAALVLAAGPVAGLYGEPVIVPLMLVLAPTVLMEALTAVPVAILKRDLRFRVLSARMVAGVGAGGVVGLCMALTGFGVWSLVGQRLALVVTNVAIVWVAAGWRPGLRSTAAERSEVWRFGRAVLSLRGAEVAAMQVPVVLIGALQGATVLGMFSLAWRLVDGATLLIATPLRQAAQPAFAALSRHSGRAGEMLSDITRLSTMLAVPAFAGLAMLAGPVVAVVFGPGWADAAPALAVLSVFGLYLCVEKVNRAFCLAAGELRATAMLAWAEAATGAVLIYAVADWGLVAMTAAFVAGFLLFWPLRLVVVSRLAWVPARALALALVQPTLAAGAMALAVLGARQMAGDAGAVVQLSVGIAAGVASYGVLALLTMRDRLPLAGKYWPLTPSQSET